MNCSTKTYSGTSKVSVKIKFKSFELDKQKFKIFAIFVFRIHFSCNQRVEYYT